MLSIAMEIKRKMRKFRGKNPQIDLYYFSDIPKKNILKMFNIILMQH